MAPRSSPRSLPVAADPTANTPQLSTPSKTTRHRSSCANRHETSGPPHKWCPYSPWDLGPCRTTPCLASPPTIYSRPYACPDTPRGVRVRKGVIAVRSARWIVALLTAALALQLAAASVAGDAGITEYRPATQIADPTATASATPTELSPAASPTTDQSMYPGGSPEPDNTPLPDDPTSQPSDASPTPVPTTSPVTAASASPGDGSQTHETPSTPSSPLPSDTLTTESSASVAPERSSDSTESSLQRSQVAPRTGAGTLSVAASLVSLALLGATLLLLGLRLSAPPGH